MSAVTDFYSANLGLPTQLLQTLAKLNYTKPTPIQAAAIPAALNNQDILGSAQTGTGKTLAFAVPLVSHLLNNNQGTAIVVTPTRELAQQVLKVIEELLPQYKEKLKTVLLIGGEPIFKQLSKLKAEPKIIVSTPGRLIDHLTRKSLKPKCSFLVLDETDRMFDMGFGIQLEKIISQLPRTRQTLMFSATLPPKIEKLVAKYLINPKRISVDPVVAIATKLQEKTIKVKEAEKYSKLLLQLQERDGSIIIFVKTKYGAERLSDHLRKEQYNASAMHGDLKQSARRRILNDFRCERYRIMVATDLAARGLDVPHVQHVINYDLPTCPEDYIHRIGRTARAGATGNALNLVSPQDSAKWEAIQRLIGGQKEKFTKTVFTKTNFTKKKFAKTNSAEKSFAKTNSAKKGFAKTNSAKKGFAKTSSAEKSFTKTNSAKKGFAKTNSAEKSFTKTNFEKFRNNFKNKKSSKYK